MKIDREYLLNKFNNFVTSGSGILIGQPGVGKTILLQTYVKQLLKDSKTCISLPIDKLGVETSSELKEALETDLDFISLLKKEGVGSVGSGDKGLLIIDSFDAARSEKAQKFFLGLIKRVLKELGESWNVIVSVRIYDAKKSEELRELFKKNGNEENEFTIEGIECRHFFIPPLSDQELVEVIKTIEGLPSIFEKASLELKGILKVPFNLWLMEKILSSDPENKELSSIQSEIQLLELFWKKRVASSTNSFDNELILKRVTQKMVSDQALSVKKLEVYHIGEQQVWDTLFSSEILTLDKNSQRLYFYHNIIFDYAVSTLLIGNTPNELEDFISEDFARPVFLRPSLDYYFTRLWSSEPGSFWKVFWHILSNQNPNLRLFVRLIPTGVIAKELREEKGIDPLIESLTSSNENASKAVLYLLQALRSLNVDRDEVWIRVLSKLAENIKLEFIWDLTIIASSIFDRRKSEIIYQQEVGKISRNLFKWMWDYRSNKSVEALGASWITPLVAKTFGSDVQESRALLSKILDIVKEKQFNIQFVTRLSYEVDSIWSYDPEFVYLIYETAFGYSEKSEETTNFGTPVLPLTSTRRQDYQMVQYELTKKMPEFLINSPKIGLKTAIACINRLVLQEHVIGYLKPGVSLNDTKRNFTFLGSKATYIPDLSFIWGESNYDDEPMRISNHLFSYLESISDDQKKLEELLKEFVKFTQVAFLWKKLLQIGAKKPDVFVNLLFTLCLVEVILKRPETSHEVGVFIKAISNLLTPKQVFLLEKVINSLPDKEEDSKKKKHLEDERLLYLSLLPANLLQTEEAKKIISNTPEKDIPKNEPHVKWESGSWEGVPEDLVDTKRKKADNNINELIASIKELTSQNRNGIPDIDLIRKVTPAAKKLYLEARGITGDDNLRLVWTSLGEFAETTSRAISKLKPKELKFAKEILLRCSENKFPEFRKDHESTYKHASWSPDPRIAAAIGLPWIAIKDKDKRVFQAISKLSNDSVPSVRFLIVMELWRISGSHKNIFWKLVNQIAAKENNEVVLRSLCQTLGRVVYKNEDKVLKVLERLKKKALSDKNDSDFLDSYISFVAWFAIRKNDKWANKIIDTFLKNPFRYARHIRRLAFETVAYITLEHVDTEIDVTNRALEFLKRYIQTVNQEFKKRVHRINQQNEEQQKKIRDLYQVIDEVVTRLYFAMDVNKDLRNNIERSLSDNERQRFYMYIKPLLIYLLEWSSEERGGLLLAPTAHHFMELLNGVLHYDPRGVLHLATQVVMASKSSGYNFDSMAVREAVEMVESILASHRSEVQNGESLQDLLTLLDLFAEAGWPEALRLVWRLDEIFR